MYARRQSDEDIDEDDMSDEELVRLVDQTNDDENCSVSVTDDPITVEEKVLEPRGSAVGADTSNESYDMEIKPEKMFKLVLAGNAAVGKSSFIIRLCKDKFYSALNSTLGELSTDFNFFLIMVEIGFRFFFGDFQLLQSFFANSKRKVSRSFKCSQQSGC